METQAVYYICLNNHCPKHRNIFTESDSEHENCERERLYLAGQREPISGAAMFAGAAIALAALGCLIAFLVRFGKPQKPQLPMIREETALERRQEFAP